MKIGNWTYKKSNNTLNFYKKHVYSYEIDLDRKISADEWIDHIYFSKDMVISHSVDIPDLVKAFVKLGFRVDSDILIKLKRKERALDEHFANQQHQHNSKNN